MELNKNAFPVKLDLQKVIEICNSAFKEKGQRIELKKPMFHLNVVPYWFCFYDIYIIKNNKPETISEQIALNAMSNKIEDELNILFDVANPKMIQKIEIPEIEKIEIRKKDLVVSKQEAKTTVEKIIAARYKVPVNNISLSGFKEIWIPFWKLETEIINIRIDAVSGKINNLDKVPKKAKSNIELYNDMLIDLRKPKNLVTYFVMVFEVIFRFIKSIFLFLIKHKIIAIIILVFLLIVILFL